MSLSILTNSCHRSVVGAVWMVLAGVPACANDAAPSANAALDGGQCSHPAAIALPPYESIGSGIIIGTDVSASVCNVGVLAYASPDSSSPDQFFMRLDYDGTSLFDFQRPAGTTGGGVGGFISVGALIPGIYTSADLPSPCGILSFGYGLRVAPEQSVLNLGFGAAAPLDCVGDRQTSMGSWTVRLTSVAEYQGDAGPPSPYYLAHGQLTASLVGAGPADTVTFALAF